MEVYDCSSFYTSSSLVGKQNNISNNPNNGRSLKRENLSIELDSTINNRYVWSILDAKTKEVLNSLPPEELLETYRAINRLVDKNLLDVTI